jgi:hypothetical protein
MKLCSNWTVKEENDEKDLAHGNSEWYRLQQGRLEAFTDSWPPGSFLLEKFY